MSKKRKIDSENRVFQDRWETQYFITNRKDKLQCLICMQVVAVCKEYNVKRHYASLHEGSHSKYQGEARSLIVSELKSKLQKQTGMFTQVKSDQYNALHASYAISLELAKAKKPYTDGVVVKKCAVEMAKVFGDSKMAKHFDSVPASHQTVQRRVAEMGDQIQQKLSCEIEKCCYFSLCIDESTDQSDVSQLLIFIRTAKEDFEIKEELLTMCSLHSTTKGRDIFEAVMKAVNSVGGFEKCSVLATDGAKAMVGPKIGLIGCLRENGMKCPALHCIIHQHALCGKSVKQSETLKKVLKVINMIRGGNRALMHRQFRNFLEEIEAEYGDLVMYNQVRWLSAGNCLKRFFELRKEIPLFLHQFSPSENLEQELLSMDFSRHLAFLTDITGHLNDVNLKLQGRGQLVSDLMAHINGFRNKLKIFHETLGKNNLSHFASCSRLASECEEVLDFSEFCPELQTIIDEFNTRFSDFESIKNDVALFSNPVTASIEEQPANLQLELCDLQADPFFQTRTERGPEFFKLLPTERFPNLRDLGLKTTSMFGSTYLCESAFSAMKFIKNRHRSSLSDSSLLDLLRLATTNIDVDIPALVKKADRPQFSH